MNIAQQRLQKQHLLENPLDDPIAVVRHLGAVQSQDYRGATWGISQRAKGSPSAAELDTLFNEGKILRTHVMRPTWHFVMPEDIRWLQMLTAARVKAISAYYWRKLELTEAIFQQTQTLMAKYLEGGKALTRKEIGVLLEASGIPAADGVRLGHIMMMAELEALVCSGPLRGKQHTYALVAERAPHALVFSRDEALARFATRYFTGHGPAQLKDFAWWSGLTTTEAKEAIALADLRSFQDQGLTYWTNDSAELPAAKADILHLLPNFDEFIIAFTDRSASFDISSFTASLPVNLFDGHFIVLNGKVIGSWRVGTNATRARITPRLLVKLTRAQETMFHRIVREYGVFRGLTTEIVQ